MKVDLVQPNTKKKKKININKNKTKGKEGYGRSTDLHLRFSYWFKKKKSFTRLSSFYLVEDSFEMRFLL